MLLSARKALGQKCRCLGDQIFKACALSLQINHGRAGNDLVERILFARPLFFEDAPG